MKPTLDQLTTNINHHVAFIRILSLGNATRRMRKLRRESNSIDAAFLRKELPRGWAAETMLPVRRAWA